MAAGTVLGILSLLAALGSGVASGVRNKKAKDYQKQRDATEKERREQLESDQRRNALMRAIKSKNVFSGLGQSNVQMPNEPDYSGLNTAQGSLGSLSQILGGLSGQQGGLFNK